MISCLSEEILMIKSKVKLCFHWQSLFEKLSVATRQQYHHLTCLGHLW
jgi:hypothetical protein